MAQRKDVQESIVDYNEFRSPEAHAELLSFEKERFQVRFTGHFCHTCGVYDYFEDLGEKLRDRGLLARIEEIQEIPDGAVVTFHIVEDSFSDQLNLR